MVLAEIITIGDELLIGQVVDTNSAWIASQLNMIGIKVKQISSVSDEESHIIKGLDEASGRADVIIMTGGLGPTKDDITKKTLCKYFNCGLKFDEPSFKIIESLFKARGKEVTPINKLQAELPEDCRPILNYQGTAPGMLFEKNGKIIISMPGVPHEMKGLMEKSVIPFIKEKYKLAPIVHKTILTQGVGESMLAEKIADWEDALPANMKLAYLPATGQVRLRISASGTDEKILRDEVEKQSQTLLSKISEHVYGFGDETLEGVVGTLLRNRNLTISTAESCTGGYIAHKITSVPGSSEYYKGSVVAYANEIKVNELQVDMHVLEKYGAVSEEVVRIMAESAIKKFKSDYSIACSGIAGPDGGTKDKPVGTVWIAVYGPDISIVKKFQLGNVRQRVIIETAQNALNILRKMLIN